MATYVIHRGDEALVYDTFPYPEQAKWVRDYLARMGIKHFTVANSHWHLDHVGGNAVYADVNRIGTNKTIEILRTEKAAIEAGQEWGAPAIAPLAIASIGIDSATEFYVGDIPVEPCLGLNGGAGIKQSEAISFQVTTENQAETDRYWHAILHNGGAESQCGWCRDRWGVSWQITPRALIAALSDDDPAAAARVFQAMMPMKKIDIAAIEAARRGGCAHCRSPSAPGAGGRLAAGAAGHGTNRLRTCPPGVVLCAWRPENSAADGRSPDEDARTRPRWPGGFGPGPGLHGHERLLRQP